MDEIFHAIDADDLELLRSLIQRRPACLEQRSAQGLSPVMHALYAHRFEVADLLAEAHGSLDLYEACACGWLERVRELCDAEPDRVRDMATDGMGALHLACYFRQHAVATELLARGADVNAEAQNPSRVRPLHAATASRDARLVELVLAHGPELDAAQAGGWTALHTAARHGDAGMTRALVEAGADRARRAAGGELALDLLPGDAAPELRTLLAPT